MNILYLNHYAGSLEYGMEFRPYYFAREWVKDGNNVRIVAGDFSHLRTKNPIVSKDFDIEVIDNIEYQWVKTGEYVGNGVKRALTMFRYVGKLWKDAKHIATEFKPDIVIASSTYPLDTYAAQRIAKFAHCKYIHEAHDLWPLTLIELGGMSKKHPFVVMLAIAEKKAYKKADMVVGLLPNEMEYMLEHGLQSIDKFKCIQNGVVIEDWNNPEDISAEYKELFDGLKKDNKFVVCYTGGHAMSNALDTLVDAAKLSENENIAYVLVGKGVEKEHLMKKAEGLKNIYFLDPVKKTQVPSVLKEADALYIGAAPCSLYRYGVSMNKVYDYMMAAKPIVYGVKAANNDVEAFGCGITIEPENPVAIVDAIRKLQSMTEEDRVDMGNKGRKGVLENYEYSFLAKEFISME